MNNAFLKWVGAAMLALCIVSVAIYGSERQNAFREASRLEEKDQNAALARYRADLEMLDMQMGDVCRDHAQHSSCRWYLEVYKERG